MIGVAIGLPLAYGVARALTGAANLYDTNAGDPVVLGAPATAGLILVAAIASYLPRRAGRVDPIIALRSR